MRPAPPSGCSAACGASCRGLKVDIASFQVTVGVWLMPDNVRDGTLEDFLRDLIETNDSLIGHADSSTAAARQLGAKFSDADTKKAVLHAWLAWQEVPGRPYGTAVKAHFFRHDSPAATEFVRWLRDLYGLQ